MSPVGHGISGKREDLGEVWRVSLWRQVNYTFIQPVGSSALSPKGPRHRAGLIAFSEHIAQAGA